MGNSSSEIRHEEKRVPRRETSSSLSFSPEIASSFEIGHEEERDSIRELTRSFLFLPEIASSFEDLILKIRLYSDNNNMLMDRLEYKLSDDCETHRKQKGHDKTGRMGQLVLYCTILHNLNKRNYILQYKDILEESMREFKKHDDIADEEIFQFYYKMLDKYKKRSFDHVC